MSVSQTKQLSCKCHKSRLSFILLSVFLLRLKKDKSYSSDWLRGLWYGSSDCRDKRWTIQGPCGHFLRGHVWVCQVGVWLLGIQYKATVKRDGFLPTPTVCSSPVIFSSNIVRWLLLLKLQTVGIQKQSKMYYSTAKK